MSPLSAGHVGELLDTCIELSRRQREIAAVLAEMPGPFGDVRQALNRLHELTASPEPAPATAGTDDRRGGGASSSPERA